MAPGLKNDEPTAVERLALWRRNVPAVCDLCIESPWNLLDWFSLTVDWLHGASAPASEPGLGSWSNHWLLLGTATNGLEPNKLLLYSVLLPNSSMEEGIQASTSTKGPLAWPEDRTCFRLAATLPHTGDVTRARSMPQCGSIVATKCSSSPTPGVYVYDVSPHLEEPCGRRVSEEGSGPVVSCCFAGTAPPEESGLCWSPAHEGLLLTTCERGQLATFQLDSGLSGGASAAAASLAASGTFSGHSGAGVNDAAFAGAWRPELFGSVAEDGTAALWDLRAGGAPVQQWQAHSVGQAASPANGVAFSTLREQQVATGGSEGKVKVWDLRGGGGAAARPPLLKVLPSHRSVVTQVAWSPHAASWLLSCDKRGLVYVWDLDAGAGEGGGGGGRAQGKAESPLPARPELRMIYGGHGKEVNDLAWCPDGARGAGLVASVSSRMDVEEEEEEREALGLEPRGAEGEAEEVQLEPHQYHSVQIWRPCLDVL